MLPVRNSHSVPKIASDAVEVRTPLENDQVLLVFGMDPQLLVAGRRPLPHVSYHVVHSCERPRETFYLTTHSTHFIYGYMVSDIWLRTILIVRKEIRCRHIGYYYRLTARVLLYAPSHRQDNTYHGLCYTSRGALAGMRNSNNNNNNNNNK